MSSSSQKSQRNTFPQTFSISGINPFCWIYFRSFTLFFSSPFFCFFIFFFVHFFIYFISSLLVCCSNLSFSVLNFMLPFLFFSSFHYSWAFVHICSSPFFVAFNSVFFMFNYYIYDFFSLADKSGWESTVSLLMTSILASEFLVFIQLS